MAKFQGKNAAAADDGFREKMIAVNRVTKVVKGGRILRSPLSRLWVMAKAVLAWARASPVKSPLPFRRPWIVPVTT